MTTFAEHAATLASNNGQTAIGSKEVRQRIATHLESVYNVPVYRAPQTAVEMPCVMIFSGGGRDYREQVGFESQRIRWSLIFMATGDEDDVADWLDDVLDDLGTHLQDIDFGPGIGALSIDRIREPIEANTGSTECLALRVEVSTIRSSC